MATSIDNMVRATEPLIPREVRRATAAQLLAEVQALMVAEEDTYHVECWKQYLARHSVPPSWRGRKDVYHYDRLMAGLTVIRRHGRGLPSAKYATFLREHIRSFNDRRLGKADVGDVMKWFKGLDTSQRRRFTDIQRDEEAQAKRQERLLKRLQYQQDAYLDSPFNYEDLDPEDDTTLRSVRISG